MLPVLMIVSALLAVVVAASLLTASYGFVNKGASVQLFEWSWNDVAAECESFLGPKGYKAVQVSPPQEHIYGSAWWTRYQPVSYKIISRSGNETQFKSMISRCASAGVSIVVDSVINHMAGGSGTGIGGTTFGSRAYSGLYSANDLHHNSNDLYHNCQVSNYKDKYNVQYCDLSGLPDLMTSSDYVQGKIADYINNMISMGIKGIRIDAAKHQDANEMAGITKRLPSGFYIGQEVIGAAGEAVQPSMYYSLGQVSEFYYSDNIDNIFIGEGQMNNLYNFGESWGMMPDQYAVAFLDNHDTQRNGRARLTYKNGDLYTFANVFMLAWPYGNTRVMSSYYFTNTDTGPPSVGVDGGKNCMDGKNWVCEHRWGPIANMVAWRNAVGTAPISNWQTGSGGNQIAFSRGGAGFIAMNRASGSEWKASLYTGFPAGSYCDVIASDDSSTCQTVLVGSDSRATVTVPPMKAVAFHVNAMKKV